MNDLKECLYKFEKMLKKYPDEPKYSYEFLSFFRSLLRIKITDDLYLPTIELGAILKKEKPQIFYDLKKLSDYNQVIDFITNVDMEYNEAQKRLNNLKEML